MSVSVGGDDGGQDFEINLAPIIDCFTVLITYMLVSASFLSLNMLDVGVSTTSDQPAAQTDAAPQMSLALELDANHQLQLQLSGEETKTYPIAATGPTGNDWNYDALKSDIAEVRQKYPSLTEISVKAQPVVDYKEIVDVVGQLKGSIPKVYLGE